MTTSITTRRRVLERERILIIGSAEALPEDPCSPDAVRKTSCRSLVTTPIRVIGRSPACLLTALRRPRQDARIVNRSS